MWYPAENTKGYKKTKWIAEGLVVTRQLAKSMHLPPFMLDHTTQIDSNSFLNAPFSTAQESYPVVVISHGWSGFRALHTDYAEELASNGFIAVSIDHTYGSQAVEFVDGQVAYINKNALSNRNRPSKYANASTLLATTYGKDVASVLDDLERKNTKDENIKGKLKMDTIGVLGHSTGGGGDVFISLKDKRVKALLGFDAWVEPLDPQQLKEGLKIPALFLRSEEWSVGPNNTSLKSLIKNSDNATLIQMNKTKHIDFSMSYMYSPITKYIGFTGQLRGRVSSDVQREYILHFFNHTLKQKDDHASGYLDEITKKYDFLKLVDLD